MDSNRRATLRDIVQTDINIRARIKHIDARMLSATLRSVTPHTNDVSATVRNELLSLVHTTTERPHTLDADEVIKYLLGTAGCARDMATEKCVDALCTESVARQIHDADSTKNNDDGWEDLSTRNVAKARKGTERTFGAAKRLVIRKVSASKK